MANALNLKSAYIRSVDIRNPNSGGVTCTIKFSAGYTAEPRKVMGWPELPDGSTGMELTGSLSGGTLILSPEDFGAEHGVEFEFMEADRFQLEATVNGDGLVTDQELQFTVKTGAPNVGRKLSDYLGTVGRGVGALHISYEIQQKLIEDAEEALPGVDTGEKKPKNAKE